ncbi:uncharacterized protein [Prorops nasuta]|uniref:uncharacterized protein isoform X2 n=1 Tax=Prorops nasuta TaxID=863751 RepID=UPI0034CFA4AE
MQKRLETSNSQYYDQCIPDHSKKNKKRSSKRSTRINDWISNLPNEQMGNQMSNIKCQHTFWQPKAELRSQLLQNQNGQRLFTAISDPSVCGYSPMPMAYAMEPVSLPPVYRLCQPVLGHNMRLFHNKQKSYHKQSQRPPFDQLSNINGYTSLCENNLSSSVQRPYQDGDYTSLPPTHNKNIELEKDVSPEHRRYSDPGLGPAEESENNPNEEIESDDTSGSSITTIGRSNKLIFSLIDQVTELKRANSQLFVELSQTKSDLENVKVKLITSKQSELVDYQPGMFLDLIQEIRQANKAFEDELKEKLRTTVDKDQSGKWIELEHLKNQISKMMKEKEESDRRILRLEEEVTALKLYVNNEDREIAAFEEENLTLRRELQEARASRNQEDNRGSNCSKVRAITPTIITLPRVTSTPLRTTGTINSEVIPETSHRTIEPTSQAIDDDHRSPLTNVVKTTVPNSYASSTPHQNFVPRAPEINDQELLNILQRNELALDKNSSALPMYPGKEDLDCAKIPNGNRRIDNLNDNSEARGAYKNAPRTFVIPMNSSCPRKTWKNSQKCNNGKIKKATALLMESENLDEQSQKKQANQQGKRSGGGEKTNEKQSPSLMDDKIDQFVDASGKNTARKEEKKIQKVNCIKKPKRKNLPNQSQLEDNVFLPDSTEKNLKNGVKADDGLSTKEDEQSF